MKVSLEICLQMFGWKRADAIEQYLRNGDKAQPEIIFYHEECNHECFALNPLRDPYGEAYAAWGFYEEGTLSHFGDDEADLLAFLTELELRSLESQEKW